MTQSQVARGDDEREYSSPSSRKMQCIAPKWDENNVSKLWLLYRQLLPEMLKTENSAVQWFQERKEASCGHVLIVE